MDRELIGAIERAVAHSANWLHQFGEVSDDHQSFCRARRAPRERSVLQESTARNGCCRADDLRGGICPARQEILREGRAFSHRRRHYAMGFAFLSRTPEDSYHQRAVNFLDALLGSRCPGFAHHCWGYPFDWVTRNGTIEAGTPLITSTPYVYEAFRQVCELDRDERWRRVCRSIAQHAITDIKDFRVSASASSCSYTPYNKGGVVNAAAYRAWLLAAASVDFSDDTYWRVGRRNLQFVLDAQRPDGSWYYSIDGERDFVDHFHTCFVLKALAKIDRLWNIPAAARRSLAASSTTRNICSINTDCRSPSRGRRG